MESDREIVAAAWGAPAPTLPARIGLPLVEELPRELRPWDVFTRLQALPRVLFLDSAQQHATLGRYSFLSGDPFDWLESRGEPGNPFDHLKARLASFQTETIPGLPPFQGGAAGVFNYELCRHLERLPRARTDEFALPELAVGFYDWVIALDHALGRSWLISTGFPERSESARRRRAAQRLRQVKCLLGSAPPSDRPFASTPQVAPHFMVSDPGHANLFSNFTRSAYLDAVRTAIEYIHAGDCFQVNLSQRLLQRAKQSPVELFRRLRNCNAAPFGGYVDLGSYQLVSASPERFLRVEDGEVEARPIKGTRPRGQTPEADRRQLDELLGSPKDRAENIMIVDLLRNDLGRVCRYGSVRVPALCRAESYRYVHHLVSEVRGRLRPECTPLDLLRAAFPGGSVTGAPKIRAMEIIAELEPTARGPYCGSLGYNGFDGSMDTNILIRTFVVAGGWVQFCVGGGIIADSVPELEYEETWHKAEGMLRALEP